MIKNLTDKLTVDETNHEYLMKNYQEGGRFRLFSGVFFGKMGAMTKANWVMLLFCIPAVAAIFYTLYLETQYSILTPFSSNYGVGYPVVNNAEATYAEAIFRNNMFRALLLVPCMVIAFIGLAGAFNVIKYESLGKDVKVMRTFFKGIKNNFVTYMWIGLVNGIMLFLFMLSVNFYGNPNLHLALKIVTIFLNSLVFAFVLVMSFYVMSQAALYDMPLIKMIKNAFWFTISFALQNFFILIFSLVPVGLLLVMGTSYFLQILVIMVCAMLGISYIVCVWTIYCHYVYGVAFTACIEKGQNKGKKSKRARRNG